MPTRTVYVVFKAKVGVKPLNSKLCLKENLFHAGSTGHFRRPPAFEVRSTR